MSPEPLPDPVATAMPAGTGEAAADGYRAALAAAVVVVRTDRGLLRVFGRDPVKMVHGLVSNDVQSLAPGHALYAAMLTPRGRMVADLRILRREADLLLEAHGGALAGVRATLQKYVPPLFARTEDVNSALAVVGIYGPESAAVLRRLPSAGGDAAVADHHASDPSVLAEDDAVPLSFRGETVFAVRTGEAGVMGFDLIVPAGLRDALCSALLQAGAKAAPLETLELLRIEAGRPRWGAELDEEVIPLEAGLLQRAISTGKGCYTGQEVIVRILHRGHVNRHLRGLLLGGASPPLPGTQLLPPGEAKPVGRVTSACVSPRLGQTIALAYVRREIAPGSTLRLDRAEAGDAVVVELPLVASA